MFAENRKISLRQMQALLLLDCFGTAVLFLPAELARTEGRACWLTALVCGLIFAGISLLLTAVGNKLPDGTVVEWCRNAFGTILGNLILLGLAAKLLFDGVMELRLFSEIICRSMLPATPVWVISPVILAAAGALAAQGMECRGRTAEVLFFFTAIPMLVILLAVAISAEYGRVLPVEFPSLEGLKTGIPALSIVFQGLVFLYFIFPDLKKPQKAQKAVLLSGILSAAVVALIVFLCLAAYGKDVLSQKLLPALQMMERVSFSGIFLTRQDVLLLWFWMASVCVFLSGTLFFGSLLGVRMCRQEERKRKQWLVWILALLFAASFLPENLSAAYELRLKVAPWLNGAYLLILPLSLLLFAKKGGKQNA